MGKYLVFGQVIIGVILCFVYFPYNYYHQVDVMFGFTQTPAYHQGDTIKFQLYSKQFSKKSWCRIYDDSERLLDSILLPISNTIDSTSAFLENGYKNPSTSDFVIPDTFSYGLYLLENTIPFIVNPKHEFYDITFVMPFTSLHCNNDWANTNIMKDSSKVKTTNLNKPILLDELNTDVFKFIKTLSNKYKIRVIPDIALENNEEFNNTSALFFYGRMPFWTEKWKQNFEDYVNNGGHAIFANTDVMNNACVYDPLSRKVVFDMQHPHNREKDYSWTRRKNPNYRTIGLSYDLISSRLDTSKLSYYEHYKIVAPKNPVVKTIEGEWVHIRRERGYSNHNLIYCKDIQNEIPIIDTNLIQFQHIELIAYKAVQRGNKTGISPIVALQKTDTSGNIIFFGSEYFLSRNNINNPTANKALQNAIELVVNNQSPFSPQKN